MSFNKRFLTQETILSYAKTADFNSFARYLLSPDAIIFLDEWSSNLWKRFKEASLEDRLTLFESVKS